MTPAAEVRAVFRDAGVRGWLHARPVTGDGTRPTAREVGVGAHVPVVMASVYKVFVLVAYCRAVDAGTIDPREPVVVPVRRTPGITGISALADPVTMSWRDLVTSMVTASDNAAADVVHTRVGRDRVSALPAELGLGGTRIRGGTDDVFADLLAETGTDLSEVLKKTGANVVFNCTVPAAHHPVTLTALRHGCHVLEEKPLADSMAHAREMVAAASKARRIFAVIQNRG